MTRTNGNGKSEKRGESKSAKARRLAAERMAEARARVDANQEDCATVLAGAELIAEAEKRRDRMIARARSDFAVAEANAQRGIGQALARWRGRGESEQVIAGATGLTVGAVRKLVAMWQEWDTPTAAADPTEPDPTPPGVVTGESESASAGPVRRGNPWRDADGNPAWDAYADEATQEAHVEASL